jgi:hypothetical protein
MTQKYDEVTFPPFRYVLVGALLILLYAFSSAETAAYFAIISFVVNAQFKNEVQFDPVVLRQERKPE